MKSRHVVFLALRFSTNELLCEIGAKANVFEMSTTHIDFGEDVFVSQMFALGVDIVQHAHKGLSLRQLSELLQREHTRLPAQSLLKMALHLRHRRVFGGTTGAWSSESAESWVIDYPLTPRSGRDR
jgi:hypothetical protein